jgi:hypothetical protein
MRAEYSQSSGVFSVIDEHGGQEKTVFSCSGYAGFGVGLNNPDAEIRKGIGPIPRGDWIVGLPFHHVNKGPLTFRLSPMTSMQTFGRGGFLIHGDNRMMNRTGSHGCIVLSRDEREKIARFRVRVLNVSR